MLCRMRFARLSTLAVAVLVSWMPVVASAQGAGTKAVVDALTKQSDAWDKAIVRKDRAAIAANMADDFRSIDGAGTVETKPVFVDSLMDAKLTIDPYTVEEFDVRLFGDVALLSGRTKMTGTFDGKTFTSHYRYIDIYAKRNGRWQIVSVQITRLPAE
jgi:ketosteroid isomerase-like protein